MSLRFVKKKFNQRDYTTNVAVKKEEKVEIKEYVSKDVVEQELNEEHVEDNITTCKKTNKNKNKSEKKQSDMNDIEKIATAEELVAGIKNEIKVVKKDKGLIERTESSKIILTEDNKQVLND